MRKIVTPIQIYPALRSLLGLPEHCLSFDLSVRHDQIGVTVTCEHFVALDTAGLKQLESVFSHYDLVHRPVPAIESAADSDEFRVVDFDAWIRDRTERAHREFMDRTARALSCR